MFRIVRNECVRRAKRAFRHFETVPERAVPSAEEEALQLLEAGIVADVIAGLPGDQRRVLIMRDVQGYSGRMTADALGISTAAMKSRLHRARAAVQEGLRSMETGGFDGR
jgi:RNA polymerase sigma factor (sigma-70 family)